MTSPIRRTAVAGQFYPDDPEELTAAVDGYLQSPRRSSRPPRPAVGVVAPHAGYMFSGGVAGQVFADVVVPQRVVVLAPNHTGAGPRVSVAARGAFELPGCEVPVDEELAARVLEEVPGAEVDWHAHEREHSIEVQLPFLRARCPDVAVVPIVIASLSESETITFGHGLARAIERVEGDVLVVASSDMSHYLPDEQAREIDKRALEPLLAFDPSELYRTVRDCDISMCGVIPATAMLAYARARGDASAPELIDYKTSGDAHGDRDRVVGYAGVVIPRT